MGLRAAITSDTIPTVRPSPLFHMNDPTFWHRFWLLYGAGMIGLVAILPYLAALIKPKLAGQRISLSGALALQFGQTALLLAIAVYFGLAAALSTSLGGALVRQPASVGKELQQIALASFGLGALTAAVVSLLDYYLLLPRVPGLRAAAAPLVRLPVWQKLAATFYGSLSEEILMRLGLFSVLVWAWRKLFAATGDPAQLDYWIPNLIVALLFGVAHLPATAALVPLTPVVIVRALVINGLLSLVFGYLYFRHGLLSSITAHLAADLFLQLAGQWGAGFPAEPPAPPEP